MDSFDKKKKQGSGGSRPSDKRGGGGAGHPDTEIIGGGARSQKNFFALRASVWSNNKGEARAPGSLPWTRHCKVYQQERMSSFSLGSNLK